MPYAMHPFPEGRFAQVSLTALRRCNEIREEAGMKALRVNGGDFYSIGDGAVLTFDGTDDSWVETTSLNQEGQSITGKERHQENAAHFLAKPLTGGFSLQLIDADAKPLGETETYRWEPSTD